MDTRTAAVAGVSGSLAAAQREKPSLVQLCEDIEHNLMALRNQHLRIHEAIGRLQNPRPEPVGAAEDPVNRPQPQTLEGRLQEIGREIDIALTAAEHAAKRLELSV